MENLSIQALFDAGVHYGHKKRFWNAGTAAYIYGVRNNQYIIDLDKTYPLFLKAIDFVKSLVKENKTILFVGCKRSAKQFVKEEAIRCEMPYVCHRWMGGTLTNHLTIYQSIRKLQDFEKKEKEGFFTQLSKKEALMNHRKMEKLQNNLGGIKETRGLPDAIFVTDVGKERNAVLEANKLGIPIIGIVDTNNSPKNIDYPVPGNDDSLRSQKLYCQTFANAILEAKADQILAEANQEDKNNLKSSALKDVNVELKADLSSESDQLKQDVLISDEKTSEKIEVHQQSSANDNNVSEVEEK